MEKLINKEALRAFLQRGEFIILNDNKTPIKAFKDGQNVYQLDDVKNESNLGLLLSDNWIVIDIDGKDHPTAASKMLEIIDHYGWQCNVMKTTRGMHFYFKLPNNNHPKNYVDVVLPIGIRADTKTSQNSYVVIKQKGQFREWTRFYSDVDYLPPELTPISLSTFKEIESPIFLKQGSRRDNLFARVKTLLNLGWSKQRIFNLLSSINSLLFVDPLSHKEVENTLAGLDELQKETQELTLHPDDFKSNMVVIKLVSHLISKYKMVRYAKQLYIYTTEHNCYRRVDDNELMTVIATITPHLSIARMNEIVKQLYISPRIPNKTPENDIIALQNCFFNLSTYKTIESTPSLFVISKINVEYNIKLSYRSEQVLKFFDQITLNNNDLRDLLFEYLGYCLTADTRYQKSLLLYGPTASNGKSTFLDLIAFFFSDANVSALGIEELDKRFTTATLIDKMVNIGADISTEHIKNSSTFKKLISGDELMAEFKGKDMFTFRNKTKFIFATNKLPSTSENSNGFFRRFIIVPFLAQFTNELNNVDKSLIYRLRNKTNMNVLFRLAIEGLKSLRARGDFKPVQVCEDILKNYEKENNNVILYLENSLFYDDEQIYKGENVKDKSTLEMYEEYKAYCSNYGHKAGSFQTFRKNVLNYYRHLKLSTRKIQRDGMIIEIFMAFSPSS
ncbi:putative DNA primase/helicase [Mycoplasmopsis mustelae]|uniref:Putative DNA primase/helicase n=1 Tax=Mycoplasmopsis mustelae TaxID=171289 RepID=A0A4V3FNV5_9BACT|nr:phage/plasmid primase, P4 family [Mycoplasmopsis mustelae]TDV23519.1 putative DNA primase/helicase [Mycoplasmopsis mustelae]